MCVHSTLRTRTFSPVGVDNGPDPSTLKHVRTTQMILEDGTTHTMNDDWTAAQSAAVAAGYGQDPRSSTQKAFLIVVV